jgi:acyl-CoA synthetase (AMP-forming)/AMP-acid ligase II
VLQQLASTHPLHALVAKQPGGTALDDFARRRTWAEIEERTTRIARLLRDDLGLVPGSHVALLMYNRVEIVELVLGAMIAGIWLTPINYHFTAEEVAYILEDSGARVLFVDAEHEDVARKGRGPKLRAAHRLRRRRVGRCDRARSGTSRWRSTARRAR